MEARGFILGGAVAHQLSAGFAPVRKKGKLPHTTVPSPIRWNMASTKTKVHEDAVVKGERVILVDDLIATGGTAEGVVKLLQKIGADVIAACFVIDLPELGGARKNPRRSACRCAGSSPSRAIEFPRRSVEPRLGRSFANIAFRNAYFADSVTTAMTSKPSRPILLATVRPELRRDRRFAAFASRGPSQRAQPPHEAIAAPPRAAEPVSKPLRRRGAGNRAGPLSRPRDARRPPLQKRGRAALAEPVAPAGLPRLALSLSAW